MSTKPYNNINYLHYLKRFTFAFIIAILSSTGVFAQSTTDKSPGTLEGRVISEDTGKYLPNAKLTIDSTNLSALTDNNGYFYFTQLPAGEITVTVAYTGFSTITQTVVIQPAKRTQQEFSLKLQTNTQSEKSGDLIVLDKFVVASTRETEANAVALNEQRYSATYKNVISTDAYGDVAEGYVGEFLKLLPGVGLTYGSNVITGITMRGMSGDLIGVTMDGTSMANANTDSRAMSFEQMNMNDVARVEISKTRLPSMPGNSIGGSINFVPRSSFESKKAKFSYNVSTSVNGNNMTTAKTGGPAGRTFRKTQPWAKFNYSNPVTSNFGFTLSASAGTQFVTQNRAIPDWGFKAADGATSFENPYYSLIQMYDAPRSMENESIGGTIDWRVVPSLTLHLGLDAGWNDGYDTGNKIWIQTGNKPVSYGLDNTVGRNGAGEVYQRPNWKRRYGNFSQIRPGFDYRIGEWTINMKGSLSTANKYVTDTESGFFGEVNKATIGKATVALSNGNAPTPTAVVKDATNTNDIDWTRLSNYTISNIYSQPEDYQDKVKQAIIHVSKPVNIFGLYTNIRFGGETRIQERDKIKDTYTYKMVASRPNGMNAGAFVDDYYKSTPKTTYGMPVYEDLSLTKLYQDYQAHPEYYTYDPAAAYTAHAQNSEWISERIDALYAQIEMKFFNDRLLLLAGLRWEKTTDEGKGLREDSMGDIAKNPDGTYKKDGSGQYIPITTDPLERAKLKYFERGASFKNTYDNFFPSVHLTYIILENLQFRAEIAKGIGRPNFKDILPRMSIDDNPPSDMPGADGKLTIKNSFIAPQESTNYDTRLEYYIGKSAYLAAGAFYRQVKKPIYNMTYYPANREILEQYGLDPDYYSNYTLATQYNGPGYDIYGVEIEGRFSFDNFLPDWARGFTLFGNGTFLNASGSAIEKIRGIQKKNGSWGIAYARKRFLANLKWIYYGDKVIGTKAWGTDSTIVTGQNFETARVTIDASVEYQLSKYLGFFATVRNLNNHLFENEYRGLGYDVVRHENTSNFGAQWSFGIKGSF